MKFRYVMSVVTLLALVATSFVGAEEAKEKAKKKGPNLKKILAKAKCPMSGRPVDIEKVVEYKDSKLYMCCPGCVKGFADKVKKDTTLAAKANHQLVMTKQARQVKCCLNGKGKINKEAKTKVAGVSVNTCCKNCLGVVTKMEEKAQIAKIFGENFEKSFVVKAQAKKKRAKKNKDA